MFFQTDSKIILVAGIALCSFATCHYSTGSMANSVCANWWKNLPAGEKPVMRVALKKRDSCPGRISGATAGRNTTYLSPEAGACEISYADKNFQGACLWDGLNSVEPVPRGQQPGWVSGSYTQNCGKKFFINRGSYYAKGEIVDACSFADGPDLTVEQGCSTIYVTLATYIELGGDPGGSGRIEIDNWDFDLSTPPV